MKLDGMKVKTIEPNCYRRAFNDIWLYSSDCILSASKFSEIMSLQAWNKVTKVTTYQSISNNVSVLRDK